MAVKMDSSQNIDCGYSLDHIKAVPKSTHNLCFDELDGYLANRTTN